MTRSSRLTPPAEVADNCKPLDPRTRRGPNHPSPGGPQQACRPPPTRSPDPDPNWRAPAPFSMINPAPFSIDTGTQVKRWATMALLRAERGFHPVASAEAMAVLAKAIAERIPAPPEVAVAS